MKKPLPGSAPASAEAPAPNWALLGGLRFGLASIVVGVHAMILFGVRHHYLYLASEMGSFAAVMAFFMVSGFSIRASIEREARGFYARRFHRIAPVYYTCLLLGVALLALTGDIVVNREPFSFPGWRTLFSSALLLNNITGGNFAPIGPGWSLTLECIYYALAPLLMRLSMRTTLFVAAISAAYYGCSGGDYPSMTGLAPILALSWAWLAGWIMYQLREKGDGKGEVARAAMIVLPLVLIGASNINGGRYSAVTVGAASLCLLYGHRLALSARARRVCSYLGELSYPLYLSHILCAVVLWHFLKVRSPEPLLVTAPLLAVLLLHGVDLPYRKLVKRFHKRRVEASPPR